jgi:hypothetical protein
MLYFYLPNGFSGKDLGLVARLDSQGAKKLSGLKTLPGMPL